MTAPGRSALPKTAALVVIAVLLALVGLAVRGGPPASAAPAGDSRGEMTFGGLHRTYQLHVPPGPPTGLVLNLHGSGASGSAQEAITNYDGIADALGLVVVYPDGIDQSWADGRGASTPDRQGVDDVGFLTALAHQLVADHGISPGRVFATGMSAGAFMANRFACDRADVVAAIAPVAGTLGSGVPCAPSRPVSVLEFHGSADGVVPFGGGAMQGRGGASDVLSADAMASRWRDADGCAGPPVEDVLPATGDGTQVRRLTGVGCAAGTAVALLRIDGGGHTWPTGNFALPTAGATTTATNASIASAQFFTMHGR